MSKIKQSKPGNHMRPLKFEAYHTDKKLCVLVHLQEYLKRTSNLAPNESNLFISFIKPHKAVSKDTIARWCKTVLPLSGIDINKYTTHSSRAAASSKAKAIGIPVSKIIGNAGWKNERTFAAFYDKVIEDVHMSSDFIR